VRLKRRRPLLLLAAAALLAVGLVALARTLPHQSPPAPEAVVTARVDPLAVLAEAAEPGDDPLILLELALLQQQAGKHAAAVETLERLVRKHPDNARGRHYLGVFHLQAGNPAEARKQFAEGVRLAPNDVLAHVHLGMAVHALGDSKQAEQHYLRARDLDPEAPTPYFALGRLDYGPGNYPQQLEYLRLFLERTARPGPAYHEMAQIYAHRGDSERAIEFGRKAVEEQPDNPVFWQFLGKAYHGLSASEHLPAAVRCFQEAAKLRPDDGSIWLDLGRAYASIQRWEEAVQAFRRARATDPDNGETHFHLGQALQALGRAEEARRELALFRLYTDYTNQLKPLQEALARDPENAALKLDLARVCMEFRQYPAALEMTTEILKAQPGLAAVQQLDREAREGVERIRAQAAGGAR
jgi:tetratricopeptide (TPR) repeat protein